MRGGLAGTLLAAATLFALTRGGWRVFGRSAAWTSSLKPVQLLALVGVPVTAAVLAAVTARLTVMRALARLP